MSSAAGQNTRIKAGTHRRWGVALLAIALVLASAIGAAAQQPVSVELQAAIRAADEAKAAYLAALATERQPSAGLNSLRKEVTEIAAAVLENYRLLEGFRSGAISVVAPDPEARRSRIVGEISTGIGRANAELALLTARAVRLEREELTQPIEDARRLYLDALAAQVLAAGAELERTPITVASVAIDGDTPFLGTWQWTDGATASGAATVAALEATLADVRAAIVRLDARLDALSQEAHWASFGWNYVHDQIVARAESEAEWNRIVQVLGDLVEVGIAVVTAGNWTVIKVIYTVADLGIRAYGYSSFEGDLAARISAIGRSRLSKELKAAIAARIRAGLLSDGDVAFATAPSLLGEVLAAPSLPLGGIGFEAAKSAVAAWVEWIENTGEQPLPLSASRAYAWLFADAPDPRAAREAIQAIEAIAGELPRFGLATGIMAVSDGVIPFLRELYYGLLGSYQKTTEELTRDLAMSELHLFLLGEQAAQLHSLLATLSQGEPALVEALAEARIQLAESGGAREFVTADGRVVDRAGTFALAPAGSVTVTVRVEGARFPWRLMVVKVEGDRETVLGAVTVEGDTASVTFAPPAMDIGPPGQIEVHVLGIQVDWQDIDGDPATVPTIDLGQAFRVGWEPGPDIYRFVFAAPEVVATRIGWEYYPLGAFRGRTGERIDFVCPPLGGAYVLTVLGTDLYTDDSPICFAAVHAGAITTAAGGTVTIEIAPRQQSYLGTERNGIMSVNWGRWGGSYRVILPGG